MRIAFDAVGIRGHGGAAFLTELAHWLPRARPEWDWDFFILGRRDRVFDDLPSDSGRVAVHAVERASNSVERLIWSNVRMPARLRHLQSDVLVSFANVGSLRAPVPQVVFVHQPLLIDRPEGSSHSLSIRGRLMMHRLLTDASLRRAASIVVQTDSMRDGLARRCPEIACRVAVVPSGYRTPREGAPIGSHVWQTIGSSSRPRLLYVSHPSEHKNHERLVAAFATVAKVFPNARLFFTIDREEKNDRRYAAVVKPIVETAHALAIADRVVWLGRLTPAEVSFALSGCDLLVYPSLAESFGLPLAEAMHVRCPIAASDRPFAHDVAGGAAVYFDPLDPVNMAATITHVLQSAELRAELIAAGRARVARFAYSRIAERLCAILESAVTKHTGETLPHLQPSMSA